MKSVVLQSVNAQVAVGTMSADASWIGEHGATASLRGTATATRKTVIVTVRTGTVETVTETGTAGNLQEVYILNNITEYILICIYVIYIKKLHFISLDMNSVIHYLFYTDRQRLLLDLNISNSLRSELVWLI